MKADADPALPASRQNWSGRYTATPVAARQKSLALRPHLFTPLEELLIEAVFYLLEQA
jgi:hypothetical protein